MKMEGRKNRREDRRGDAGRPMEEGRVERRDIERLMDEISSQSFPASDPPAWGVVASRLEELRHGSGSPRSE